MKNKAIATICVALVFITALFVACGKDPTTTLSGGEEYPLVTNEEGNTVVNSQGQIVVYATDADKNYVTNANGERQTAAVTFPNVIASKNYLETANFKMVFPDGWTVDNSGIAFLNKNDKVSIKIVNLGKFVNGETPELIAAQQVESIESLYGNLKDKYPNSTVEQKKVTVSKNELSGYNVTLKVMDANNQTPYYQECICFAYNNERYAIEYVCNGEGYDEAFNLMDVINQNLTMK